MTLTEKDINCDGCQSGSERMFNYCRMCRIRDCCQARNLKTCAEYGDYPCDSLNSFFDVMPDANKGMVAIRGKMIRYSSSES